MRSALELVTDPKLPSLPIGFKEALAGFRAQAVVATGLLHAPEDVELSARLDQSHALMSKWPDECAHIMKIVAMSRVGIDRLDDGQLLILLRREVELDLMYQDYLKSERPISENRN